MYEFALQWENLALFRWVVMLAAWFVLLGLGLALCENGRLVRPHPLLEALGRELLAAWCSSGAALIVLLSLSLLMAPELPRSPR